MNGNFWQLWRENSDLIPIRRLGTATIFDFQRALVYRDGLVVREIGPGRHRFWRPVHLRTFDIRPTRLIVQGQELMSADGATVRLSVGVSHRVEDLRLAVMGADDRDSEMHLAVQLAMRETVTTRPLDEVTQGREAIALAMKPAVEAEFKRLGHVLLSLDVRDLVLPGDLRKAMNAVHAARLEGQAKLEKARAESATLRNLANAARLAAETPALLQLRALQAVEASGGTVVLGGNPSPN